MTKKYEDMTLTELREEAEAAYMMATIGRDPAWMQVIEELDKRIKAKEKRRRRK